MAKVLIIEDDPIMAECIALALGKIKNLEIGIFSNAIEAMPALDTAPPDLICLDILLSGPDGFSFLNELSSYPDTSKIPVIIITSLDLNQQNLSYYNVRQVFQKATMLPQDISACAEEILAHAQ